MALGMVESGYSSSHLQVRHSAVKRLLEYLVDIEENERAALLLTALDRIKVPRDTRRKPKPPPLEDSLVQRLLDAAGKRPGVGPRDRALLHFIWTTGVRFSEVAGVSLDGLHLDERSATVRGKGDKERLVFFDDPCREDLVRWLENRKSFPQRPEERAFFLNADGGALSPATIRPWDTSPRSSSSPNGNPSERRPSVTHHPDEHSRGVRVWGVDWFTRKRVVALAPRFTSTQGAAFLKRLVAQFPFPVQTVQSDGGSEFLKEFGPAVAELQLTHYFNRPNYPQGNGRIERSFRTDEEEFYQVEELPADVAGLEAALLRWNRVYETVRPHQALGYPTPEQFYQDWLTAHSPGKEAFSDIS